MCVLCHPRRRLPSFYVEVMSSFMGRGGAGTGAAGRALSPLRSRLRQPASQRSYLSIPHLRSLHLELVELLEYAGAAALTPFPVADGTTLSKRQGRRLVEILRAIAELVSEEMANHFGIINSNTTASTYLHCQYFCTRTHVHDEHMNT